ncbi:MULTISPECIES: hypothetical protein [unclassified Agrococcus]|uniref:hypothetical protein n=1 Tax=unclassified Agrococcus TaxID=2615065 RepID=UPI0036170AF6
MSARVPLPAGTTLGKSHEYGVNVDVSIDGATEPTWQPARRIDNLAPTWTPTTQDIASYDDGGSPNQSVVAWALGLAYQQYGYRSETTGKFLPEIDALIRRSLPDALDGKANVGLQFYHKPDTGIPDPDFGFEAQFRVTWSRVNTASDGNVEKFAYTCESQGPVRQIPNPFTGWETEPETP